MNDIQLYLLSSLPISELPIIILTRTSEENFICNRKVFILLLNELWSLTTFNYCSSIRNYVYDPQSDFWNAAFKISLINLRQVCWGLKCEHSIIYFLFCFVDEKTLKFERSFFHSSLLNFIWHIAYRNNNRNNPKIIKTHIFLSSSFLSALGSLQLVVGTSPYVLLINL